jgi:benzoylformate decarboxylase
MPNGADRVIELLRDEGVDRVFGNPGSTELALVDSIVRGDIAYVLGLHEGCVVPMADGYAQATGRPAFVNLHTQSGLGNAIGVLANAKANGTPLVVTAGQQHRALLPHAPLLGYDLVAMARPVVKWAAEASSVEEVGLLLRRAFLDSAAAPAGPVFVSLPHDLLLAPAPAPFPPRSRILGAGIASGVEEIAAALDAARAPAIIVGQELASTAGARAVISLAERLDAPLYGAFNLQRGVVSPNHPLWRGDLPATAAALARALRPHDTILHAGGQAFQLFMGAPERILSDGVTFIHLAPEPTWLGRSEATTLGAYGDLAATLASVTDRLTARPSRPPLPPWNPAAEPDTGRFDARAACRILLDALPPAAIVHNELPALGMALRSLFRWRDPDQFYSSKQTIGWAMGAAIGVSLGHDRQRRSLAIIGDGSAAFSLPALWTAVREQVPVLFAIVDNGGYGILETMTRAITGRRSNCSPAFQLNDQPLHFARLAEGFGMPAVAVGDAEALRDAVEAALARPGPSLLHIKVAPEPFEG